MNLGWLALAMGAALVIVGGYIALLLLRSSRLRAALDAVRKSDTSS